MILSYIPTQKKTGNPIMVIDAPGNITTSKGSSGKYQNHDFISGLEGIGDLKMSWIDRDVSKGNKETFGKSCVLEITNFRHEKINQNLESSRIWFCRGNFSRPGLEEKPIVISDKVGKNRKNSNFVEYKNVKFSMALNNAISVEKSSGASTVLRVFEN